MTTIKEAVATASTFILELYPEAQDLRLEQIEMSGNKWEVVMSFRASDHSSRMVSLGQPVQPSRIFKEVDVNRTTGEAVGLRMFKA